MNDFDQAARYAVRHLGDEASFFAWLMGERFTAAWQFCGWLDTQSVPFPGDPDQRCDTVAAFERVAQDHPPLALIVEFMSCTRTPTLRRLARYGFQIQEDCLYQRDPRIDYDFVSVVVNLTGGAQSGLLVIAPPDISKLGLRGKFGVRTLAKQSGPSLLGRVRSGKASRVVLVWAPLMMGADALGYVSKWRGEAEKIADARVRGDVAGLALVLSDLVDRRDIWKRGLEGFNVERSAVVQEWEQRGEQRGEQRARVENLLSLLRARAGKPLPESIRQTITSQADVAVLAMWFQQVIDSEESFDSLCQHFNW